MKRILLAVTALIFGASAHATATNPMDQIFAGVDLSSIASWVGGAGLTIVSIAMAFKGITLAKRAISKA